MQAISRFFQSGEAPSRGPIGIRVATKQAASTSMHQYVIYTQLHGPELPHPGADIVRILWYARRDNGFHPYSTAQGA